VGLASLPKSGGHFEAFPYAVIVDFRLPHPSLCCEYGPPLNVPVHGIPDGPYIRAIRSAIAVTP
jgi:hypothetical protein